MRNGREGYDLASIAFGYPSERPLAVQSRPMLVRGFAPKTLILINFCKFEKVQKFVEIFSRLW